MAKLSRVMIECFVDGLELSYEFMITSKFTEAMLEDYLVAVNTQTALRIDSFVNQSRQVTILSGDILRCSTIDVDK